MKRIIALLLMVSMLISLAACGGGFSDEPADTDAAKEDVETVDSDEDVEPADEAADSDTSSEGGTSIAVSLASEPDTIDPALNSAVDGGTMIVHLFAGLAKWDIDEEGTAVIKPDLAEELVEPEINDDGTATYTYTIREGATWTDGEPVTAHDFAFAWQRAASPELSADYNYMFDLVVGYDEMWEMDEAGEEFVNPDAKLAVEALDDSTLTVTTTNPATYWDELLAFPTLFPVREDVVADEAWATDPATYVSNGAYKLTGWEHDSVITVEKNPDYLDADEIKMEKIEFYLSNDANNMLTNFQNGAWQLIDDVPTNEIAALEESNPDEFFVEGQIGTYYVCYNINESLLPADSDLTGEEAEKANEEIRKGLSLLIDRTYIVESVAQGGQIPAASFVAMGMTEPDGSQFYENAGPEDYAGYFDTDRDAYESVYAEGFELLKKHYDLDEGTGQFTNVPAMTYLYNTSEGHQAIGEYIQGVYASVGLDMSLENQEWNTFLNTRKDGDYTVARNGWIADYNDPISFLDMWTTVSGNNDVQFGKGPHAELAIYSIDFSDLGSDLNVENGTWAQTYDEAIRLIKLEEDAEVRYEMMHRVEDLLMSTGAIVPIYYYTDLFMLSKDVDGFFSTPLGWKFFKYCEVK
ncbi:MAG: peptide ABC transporter substrate-binding protein [Clostridiaceae bacterium]|nr:peptide ABC transporter substrate-binding protein [Clostridiaceae bacterium]